MSLLWSVNHELATDGFHNHFFNFAMTRHRTHFAGEGILPQRVIAALPFEVAALRF